MIQGEKKMVTRFIAIMIYMFFWGIGLKYLVKWYKQPKDREGRRGKRWWLHSCIGLLLLLSWLIGHVWHDLIGIMKGLL